MSSVAPMTGGRAASGSAPPGVAIRRNAAKLSAAPSAGIDPLLAMLMSNQLRRVPAQFGRDLPRTGKQSVAWPQLPGAGPTSPARNPADATPPAHLRDAPDLSRPRLDGGLGPSR